MYKQSIAEVYLVSFIKETHTILCIDLVSFIKEETHTGLCIYLVSFIKEETHTVLCISRPLAKLVSLHKNYLRPNLFPRTDLNFCSKVPTNQ
jgi:hypothetical protein